MSSLRMCLLMAAVASLAVTPQAWNLGFLQSHSASSRSNASGLPSSNNTVPTRPSFLQVLAPSDSNSGSQNNTAPTKPSFLQVVASSDSSSGSQEAEVANDAAANAALHKDVDEIAQATDDEHEYEEADETSHFGQEDVGVESEEGADQDGDEVENDSHDAEEAEDEEEEEEGGEEEDEEESAAKESRHLFAEHHGEASEHDEDSDYEESSDHEEDSDDETESDDEDNEEVEIADPDSESDSDEMDGQQDSFVEIDEEESAAKESRHLFEEYHEGELDTDDSEAEEAWEHDEENYRLEA